MPIFNDCKDTFNSNLLTMGITSAIDKRQAISEPYTMPSKEIRLLRAKLIFEEAMETIKALDCYLYLSNGPEGFTIKANEETTPLIDGLNDIIDGCCDTIYVCTGTLAAMGIYDFPHMREVCDANNRKFPKGAVVVNENGKFQKPEGWRSPDHKTVQTEIMQMLKEKVIMTPGEVSAQILKAIKLQQQ